MNLLILTNSLLRVATDAEKIARAETEKMSTEFNCVKLAQYVLKLIETEAYNVPLGQKLVVELLQQRTD